MPSNAESKRLLRAALDVRRRALAPEVADAAARSVAALVSSEARLSQARLIGFYASHAGELPTRPTFEATASLPARRCFPRVCGARLEWIPVDRWDELVEGRFGILEPSGGSVEAFEPADIVLVPGVAFDAEGWRLGRGGGHYDRSFPAGRPAPCLVGVGYAFQKIERVPHDSHDRQVDAIVTEEGWFWRTERR